MKQKILQTLKNNQLLLLLMLNMIISILIAVGATIWIINQNVSSSFISKYAQSNQIILDSTKNTFYRLGNDVKKIADYMNIPEVETFLKHSTSDTVTELNATMEVSKVIDRFKQEPNYSILHLGIIGAKKAIQPNGEIIIESTDKLQSIIQEGKKSNAEHIYPFLSKHGFTKETYNQSGIYYIYPLKNQYFQTYGHLLIFITSNDLSKLFSTYFNKNVENVKLIDQKKEILASNHANEVGHSFTANHALGYTQQKVQLPVYAWELVSTINHYKLLGEFNILPGIFVVCGFVLIFVFIISYYLLRKLTKPIYRLIHKLTLVQKGQFDQKLEIEGSEEIKQLASVYNDMLDELQKYFDKIIEEEQAKRKYELQALHYQIQPHFIYNTLTAIKMLVYEGDNMKVIQAIESFIQLLRSTLSNTDKFHSVAEEEKILTHYIYILQLRFGTNIRTTIIVHPTLRQEMIPKMIIQPLIENAYSHAFSNQSTGNINVFIQPMNQKIQIEVLDNGQGFNPEKVPTPSKNLNYTKIGLKNIENKLKMLYGHDASLSIHSNLGIGTSILIQIPMKHSR